MLLVQSGKLISSSASQVNKIFTEGSNIVRYTTPWAFYDNQKQPVGDNNSLLFLGVSQFGCPESFAVGDPPATGKNEKTLLFSSCEGILN